MTDLELRLTDLLARKADEVNVRPVDGFAEAPYMTALASTDPSLTEALDVTAIGLQPTSALPAANRNRRRGAALIVAAATVAAIALIATRERDRATPADQPSPIVPGFDTIGPEVSNPLELILGSETSGADVELFRVTSDEPRYWRLTTLPEFDGLSWRLPNSPLSPIDDTAASQPDRHTIHQQLQILALQGQLLPAAADPEQVYPNTDIRLNADTSTLVSVPGLMSGDQFTIVSQALDVTLDELRAATTANPPDEIFLELPNDVPSDVSDIAAQVTAGATTEADRMIALQDWFRTFEFSTDVQPGNGSDAIETLLATRSGFSEQFASTFAVMARTLGIPSRVAVGFTPGQLNADGSYSVTGANAHAWPELWFDGIGWVDFEPTPQRALDNDATPADQPSPTVTVSPTTPPRPLSSAEGELEPGTYYVDEVGGTPTPRISATIGAGWVQDSGVEGWSMMKSDIGTISIDRPVTVFLDACHPNDGNHPGPVTTLDGLVAALTEQHGWAEVTALTDLSVDGYVGKAFQRTAPADMSDCDTRSLSARKSRGPYPDFRSWETPDGGPSGGFYYEPGGIETLWILDIDGAAVVINVDLWPEPSAPADFATDVLDSIHIDAWSPELTAVPLQPPMGCDPSLGPFCPHLVASPDGTLVAMGTSGTTLIWYEDEPREVPLTNALGPNILWAIGPYDIAYITTPSSFVAVAPSGEEITRIDWPSRNSVYPTATGLVPGTFGSSTNDLLMPWVDLDGNPITDTTPYPTWTATDAGIEVRLGEREWLLTDSTGTRPGTEPLYFHDLLPRSDGGVVMVLDTAAGEANVFELLPDGTIERYFVNAWPLTALPDGSLIVGHNLQLIRLTLPA